MNLGTYTTNGTDRERPAILYADGEYLAIAGLIFEAAEAATVPITELEQGSALHRLHDGCHVEVSLSDGRRAHGWLRDSAGEGYDLEIYRELEEAPTPVTTGGADHTTASLIREQLVEHLYHREQLHVALVLDEPYAGPGASEECAYLNGAITALCELALKGGLYRIVAAADLRAITSLREQAQRSLEEILLPEGKLEDITFARAVLGYLDGEKIEPH